MPLLPNRGPPLPKTHELIPADEMRGHVEALRGAAADGPLTPERIEALATERGVERARLYAAASVDPNLVLETREPVLMAICVGGCQEQGAIDVLEALLSERARRVAGGKQAFDVLPRSCLDMCPHSPVVMTRSSQGTGAHPKMKPTGVGELVAAVCDDH